MKLFKKLNSKGFSHLEVLIVIIVVAAVAGTGFYVYKHHKNNESVKNKVSASISKNSTVKNVVYVNNEVCIKNTVCVNPKAIATNDKAVKAKGPLPFAHAGSTLLIADGLNYLTGGYGFRIFASSTYINLYGGVYQATLFYVRPTDLNASRYWIADYRPGVGWVQYLQTDTNGNSGWLDGVYGAYTMNFYAPTGDVIYAGITSANGYTGQTVSVGESPAYVTWVTTE